jgi:hypothetical protein
MDEQALIDRYQKCFERLADALEVRGFLPTSTGMRPVTRETAAEFSLMQVETGVAYFKHSDTRNYLLILADGGMRIPNSGATWEKGIFDRFEVEGLPAIPA